MKEPDKRFSAAGVAAGMAGTENNVSPQRVDAGAPAAHRMTFPVDIDGGDAIGDAGALEDALALALTEMEERFETVSTAILNRLDDMGHKVDELEQQLQALLAEAPVGQDAEDKYLQPLLVQPQQQPYQSTFVRDVTTDRRIAGADDQTQY